MLEPDSENLGPVVTWTIRNVPTAIRDRVVAQVGRDETVADVLTRLVLQGGHPSDASANASYAPVSNADLATLAQAAATLASADLPTGLKREALAAIRDRFRAARGLPPKASRSRPAQLTDQSGRGLDP
jgi:hypothetical protein